MIFYIKEKKQNVCIIDVNKTVGNFRNVYDFFMRFLDDESIIEFKVGFRKY